MSQVCGNRGLFDTDDIGLVNIGWVLRVEFQECGNEMEYE